MRQPDPFLNLNDIRTLIAAAIEKGLYESPVIPSSMPLIDHHSSLSAAPGTLMRGISISPRGLSITTLSVFGDNMLLQAGYQIMPGYSCTRELIRVSLRHSLSL
jgi:hypothetical protein